jgi:hypothetical protein
MDTARIERDLAIVDRALDDLREAVVYRPRDPEITREEVALVLLREKIEAQLWERERQLQPA